MTFKVYPQSFEAVFPLFFRLWFEGEREQCKSAVTGGEIKGAASLPNDPRTASWTHSWVSWLVQTHLLCKNYQIRDHLKIYSIYLFFTSLSLRLRLQIGIGAGWYKRECVQKKAFILQAFGHYTIVKYHEYANL